MKIPSLLIAGISILPFLVSASHFPAYAEQIYKSQFLKDSNFLGLAELGHVIELYPDSLGPEEETGSQLFKGQKGKRTGTGFSIISAAVANLHEMSGIIPKTLGLDLVGTIQCRVGLFNLAIRYTTLSWEEEQSVVEIMSLILGQVWKDSQGLLINDSLFVALNDIMLDCRMVIEVMLSSKSQINIDFFFLMILDEFLALLEFLCKTDTERAVIISSYFHFARQRINIQSFGRRYQHSLAHAGHEVDLVGNLVSDENCFMMRVHRNCQKPFTTERHSLHILRYLYQTDLIPFISLMNQLSVQLLHLHDALSVITSLEKAIEQNCVFIMHSLPLKLAIFYLHFGVSSHVEYVLNRPLIVSVIGHQVIRLFENLYELFSGNPVMPLFNSEMAPLRISFKAHQRSMYKAVTEPQFQIFPRYLMDELEQTAFCRQSPVNSVMMRACPKISDLLMSEILRIVSHYDGGRKVANVVLAERYTPFMEELETLSTLSQVFGVRSRLAVSHATAYIHETIDLFTELARSHNIYTVELSKLLEDDVAFIKWMYENAIIIGERQMFDSKRQADVLYKMINFVNRQRANMLLFSKWTAELEEGTPVFPIINH